MSAVLRLLERRFSVRVPVEQAWTHVACVERTPSWARHIRSIELRPPGALRPDSEGLITLSNGLRSRFRVTELEAGRSWRWVGPFLWITVHYDHQFRPRGASETEILFRLDAQGFGVAVFGRLFAAIYARSLDRAIPRLIRELEQTTT